jgi:hypothetical protein
MFRRFSATFWPYLGYIYVVNIHSMIAQVVMLPEQGLQALRIVKNAFI